MTISDEILSSGDKMARLRLRVQTLVTEVGASAGFLVDEHGNPFATVGHVEFRLPYPLAGWTQAGADPILGALVGAPPADGDSRFLVERVAERALVVLVLDAPPTFETRAVVRSHVAEIARLL
jgi:hypothetical protein